jgi:hypothetical protein
MANRSNKQGKDQQVIQGVQKDLSTMSSLLLGAETFTPATLVAFVQSRIDAGNKVGTARAAWLDAVKAYEAVDTQADVVVHDLKQLVIAAFGATSVKLADFGFAPRKVTVLTPAQKAAAALKRKATRAARNTLGPKAKLAIKGTVTTTAPATAATPAAPAGQTAPVTAPNGTPPAATPATPGQAPTVTVNVTTAPAAQTAQTVASPATAPEPTQAPAGAQATTKA